MIDIHSHCLPGIDDGARDFAAAVAMCRLAAADGCTAIVATPHQGHGQWSNLDPPELDRLRAAVQAEVGALPAIRPGGEIRVSSELLASLDDPRRAGFLPLAESRYLLLELPRHGPVPDPEELTHELTVAGWFPIFAHPEFIPALFEDFTLLRRLARMGALFQITAMALTGDFGRRRATLTRRLVDEGLAHFVASDAHGPRRRPPGLTAARRTLRARWGDDVAHALTEGNPRAVLADQPLPVPQWAG